MSRTGMIGALTIVVVVVGPLTPCRAQDSGALGIAWSDPPNGFVDVGQDRDAEGRIDGIDRIQIAFAGPVELSHEAIKVRASLGVAPAVKRVFGFGSEWTIEFDRPLPPGGSTIIDFLDRRAMYKLSFAPGDLNLDGVSDEEDVLSLERELVTAAPDVRRFDVDRNGSVDQGDLSRLVALLAGNDGGPAWLGVRAPIATDGPAVCCCNDLTGSCSRSTQSCPYGSTPVNCPCTSGSCSTSVSSDT